MGLEWGKGANEGADDSMWSLDVWVCRMGLFNEIMMFFPLCLIGGVRSARLGVLWLGGWLAFVTRNP